MDSFRPNVWLEHLGTAPWPPLAIVDELRVGEGDPIRLLLGGLSTRCAVTRVDQRTGHRAADTEPLAWLARNWFVRAEDGKRCTFGANGVFPLSEIDRTLRVGDPVVVVREKRL